MHNAHPGRNQSLDTPRRARVYSRMAEKRKFLGVHFKCCNAYARVYMDRRKNAYRGSCPRCGKRVDIGIGPGGTDTRFFSAQ